MSPRATGELNKPLFVTSLSRNMIRCVFSPQIRRHENITCLVLSTRFRFFQIIIIIIIIIQYVPGIQNDDAISLSWCGQNMKGRLPLLILGLYT